VVGLARPPGASRIRHLSAGRTTSAVLLLAAIAPAAALEATAPAGTATVTDTVSAARAETTTTSAPGMAHLPADARPWTTIRPQPVVVTTSPTVVIIRRRTHMPRVRLTTARLLRETIDASRDSQVRAVATDALTTHATRAAGWGSRLARVAIGCLFRRRDMHLDGVQAHTIAQDRGNFKPGVVRRYPSFFLQQSKVDLENESSCHAQVWTGMYEKKKIYYQGDWLHFWRVLWERRDETLWEDGCVIGLPPARGLLDSDTTNLLCLRSLSRLMMTRPRKIRW
jgi:hypothetical protein